MLLLLLDFVGDVLLDTLLVFVFMALAVAGLVVGVSVPVEQVPKDLVFGSCLAYGLVRNLVDYVYLLADVLKQRAAMEG